MRQMIKLTDARGYTRRGLTGETHWVEGETVRPTGTPARPIQVSHCGPGVIHCYATALEAVLYDPIHAAYLPSGRAVSVTVDAARVWTDGLKWWTDAPVTVGAPVTLPAVTLTERVAWAIVLAPHPATRTWAIEWLSGRDRTAVGAWMAQVGAAMAAEAAAMAAAAEAAMAAEAAAMAAAAAEAAEAAEAAKAAAAAGGCVIFGRSLAAWDRAQAILAGTYPAEQYDAPLMEETT